jgi:hypothetical protein
VVESDNNLTTVATNELDDLIAQDVSGSSLSNVVASQPDDKPVNITSNGIELAQSGFTQDATVNAVSTTTRSDTDCTNGQGEGFGGGVDEVITFNFTTEYDIQEPRVAYRYDGLNAPDSPGFTIELDGQVIAEKFGGGTLTDLEWRVRDATVVTSTLSAGSHTFELVGNGELGGGGEWIVDRLAVFDADEQSLPLDNTLNTSGGHLDDPKLYPDTQQVEFNTVTTDIPVDIVTVSQNWNDTTEDQRITIVPGTSFSNTQNGSIDYTQRVTELNAKARLSRYPKNTNPQNDTPRFGYNGQVIQTHQLSLDLLAIQRNEIGEVLVRSFTDVNTANSETFAEGGQQSNGTLITRARVPEFTKQSGQRVVSSERLRWINDPEN